MVLTFLRNAFGPVAGPSDGIAGKLGDGNDGKVDVGIYFFDGMGLPRGGNDHGHFFGGESEDGVGERIVPDAIGGREDGVEAEGVGGSGARRIGWVATVL